MRAATLKYGLFPVGMLSLILFATGCQKKCQQPAQQAFTSITQAQWRLVSTTDPKVSPNLTNFTFLIWSFSNNFTGQIVKVINNEQYNNPVFTFQFNVDPSANVILIDYQTPGQPTTNAQGQQTAGSPTDNGTFQYSYNLTASLDLYDSTEGYSYHFVPFQGIVNPDESCTF
jgi:hypothetical protein